MDPHVAEAKVLLDRLLLLIEQVTHGHLCGIIAMASLLIHRATIRLLTHTATSISSVDGDRLLTAKEAASILGVSENWIQERSNPRHPEYLTCTRRLSARKLRYSERLLRARV